MRPHVLAIGLLLTGTAVAEDGPRQRSRQVAPGGCATAPPFSDEVQAITPHGDLRLASGRVATLSGVRLPDAEGPRTATLAPLERLRGGRVAVALLGSGNPDRWGRVAAVVSANGPESPDVAAGFVAQGLAPVDAGESDTLCRPGLLAVENAARRARLGIWGDDASGPLSAEDPARLRGVEGRFVLLQGRIHSVGERRTRTYLDFGPLGRKAATVTVPKRSWARLREQGVTAAGLRGRSVRVRGTLESWRGRPTLDLVAPELLEFLDGEAAGPR